MKKIEKIALKVMDNNGLFTKEEAFARYVEYYHGYKLEIELEVLKDIIDGMYEDTAGTEYYPEKVSFEYLTKEEYEYFNKEMKKVFKKLSKVPTNTIWVKEIVEDWLSQMSQTNYIS